MIELTTLDELDNDQVEQIRQELQSYLADRYPDLVMTRGVFSEIVISAHAILHARDKQTLQRYLDSRSLLAIGEDPTLIEDDVVDHILSNFLIDRQLGSQSRGTITIIVSGSTTVTIAAGQIFAAGGQQFTADTVYSARSIASQVIAPGDRLLRKLVDGTYAFEINVTSVAAGPATLLTRNTTIIPEAKPRGFVTAYATSDFVGGLSAESNEALINRLYLGVAAKGAANRTNIAALIRDQSQFAEITNISVIGHGDIEMTRDQRVWPISTGNMVDVYARGRETPLFNAVNVQAIYKGDNGEGGTIWGGTIDKTVFPGFYEIAAVAPAESDAFFGSNEITEQIYSLDVTDWESPPDIVTPSDVAFTAFERCDFEFIDTSKSPTQLSVGDSAEYTVTLFGTPSVAELQQFLSARENSMFGGDVLVKAPIPCFVEVNILIERTPGSGNVDTDAIAAAVIREINQTTFSGRLYASRLHDVVGALLPSTSRFAKANMLGRIINPLRESVFVQSNDVLAVPKSNHPQVSPRTVQFFASTESVSVEVTDSIPQPV